MGSFDAGYGSSIMSRLVSFHLIHINNLMLSILCLPSNFLVINNHVVAKQVGPKKAREMWFLARFYTAQEAEKMGLINTVVPVNSFSLI